MNERRRAQPEPGHPAAPQPAPLRDGRPGPAPGSSSSLAGLAVFAVLEIRRRGVAAQGGPGREHHVCRARPTREDKRLDGRHQAGRADAAGPGSTSSTASS
ncbi:MAG: hypothetical protein M0C28_15415 [Candidatus Moduliflexus flocculans]|nr:hypothetical protein [Candidatus Moduliflexus flocculans]